MSRSWYWMDQSARTLDGTILPLRHSIPFFVTECLSRPPLWTGFDWVLLCSSEFFFDRLHAFLTLLLGISRQSIIERSHTEPMPFIQPWQCAFISGNNCEGISACQQWHGCAPRAFTNGSDRVYWTASVEIEYTPQDFQAVNGRHPLSNSFDPATSERHGLPLSVP
jgi:hypothetical protein